MTSFFRYSRNQLKQIDMEKTEMSLSMTNDEMHCIFTLATFWLMGQKATDYKEERDTLKRFSQFIKNTESDRYNITCEVEVEDLSDELIF